MARIAPIDWTGWITFICMHTTINMWLKSHSNIVFCATVKGWWTLHFSFLNDQYCHDVGFNTSINMHSKRQQHTHTISSSTKTIILFNWFVFVVLQKKWSLQCCYRNNINIDLCIYITWYVKKCFFFIMYIYIISKHNIVANNYGLLLSSIG